MAEFYDDESTATPTFEERQAAQTGREDGLFEESGYAAHQEAETLQLRNQQLEQLRIIPRFGAEDFDHPDKAKCMTPAYASLFHAPEVDTADLGRRREILKYQTYNARQICKYMCVLAPYCQQYAMDRGLPGIWGGTSDNERKKLLEAMQISPPRRQPVAHPRRKE
jgi:Transcription factor WhiB